MRHFTTFCNTWRHFVAPPLFTEGQRGWLYMKTWCRQRRRDVRVTAKTENEMTTGPMCVRTIVCGLALVSLDRWIDRSLQIVLLLLFSFSKYLIAVQPL